MASNTLRRITDVIDPGDALFGLIMALTFTVGSRLIFTEEGLGIRKTRQRAVRSWRSPSISVKSH